MNRLYDFETDCFTPRDCLTRLVDIGKKCNLIAPLGSAMDRLYVSVMLIREFSSMLRKPCPKDRRWCVYLVDRATNIKSVADLIRIYTNLNVGEIFCDIHLESEAKQYCAAQMEESEIFVTTGTHFMKLLDLSFIPRNCYCLVIFEDCHLAIRSHPYRNIVKEFLNIEKEYRPRLLGLTMSLINDLVKADCLQYCIDTMQEVLCSKVVLTILSPAKRYLKQETKVVSISYPSSSLFSWNMFDDYMRHLLTSPTFILENLTLPNGDDMICMQHVLESMNKVKWIHDEMGPWCAWKVCQKQEMQLNRMKRIKPGTMQYLLIEMGQTYLRCLRKVLENHVKNLKTFHSLGAYITGHVYSFFELLSHDDMRAKFADDENFLENFCCIVFFKHRYIAYMYKILLKTLQNLFPDMFGYLKVDFLVGYDSETADASKEALHERQHEVLKKFRTKELNCLLTTRILARGIELRGANCVIHYDEPESLRSFIYAKNRANKPNSHYFILLSENRHDSSSAMINTFVNIDKIIRNYSLFDYEDDNLELPDDLNDTFKPYYPKKAEETEKEEEEADQEKNNNVCATLANSIRIVNQYCQRLPCDIFSRLVADCHVEKVMSEECASSLKYKATLKLPINSPVKELIFGPTVGSAKLARMSVALEAVKLLHRRGELYDSLMPIGKEMVANLLIADEDDEEWPVTGKAFPGSSKRRQYYNKAIPECLKRAIPVSDKSGYFHAIIIREVSDVCNGEAKISQPEIGKRILGIFSSKPIPQVPAFMIYDRKKSFLVEIKPCASTMTVNKGQMVVIAEFNMYIFSEILKLEKYSMKYQPDEAENAFFIIPSISTETDYILDWPFIMEVVNYWDKLPRRPDEEQRKNFVFDISKYDEKQFSLIKIGLVCFNIFRYKDAVVMPWYRSQEMSHCYFVLNVDEGLSPLTKFPDDEYESFKSYFWQKYGLEIYHDDQPLLNVDYTASRLNRLFPRRQSRIESLEADYATMSVVAQKQKLVPELVDIHPIPASTWRFLQYLPSILYRLSSLLLANELRRQVLLDEYSNDPTPDGYCWAPIDRAWLKETMRMTDHGCSSAKMVNKNSQNGAINCSIDSGKNKNSSNSNNLNNSNIKSEDNAQFGQMDFEISVWDPVQEFGFISNFTDGAKHDFLDENSVDLSGEHLTLSDGQQSFENYSMQLGDYDSGMLDSDEEIYFDTEFSRKFMNVMVLRGSCGQHPFGSEFGPSIEPSGWEVDDVPPMPTADEQYNVGLQFVSAGQSLNVSTLLADVRDADQKVRGLQQQQPNAKEEDTVRTSDATAQKVPVDPSGTEAKTESRHNIQAIDTLAEEETVDLNMFKYAMKDGKENVPINGKESWLNFTNEQMLTLDSSWYEWPGEFKTAALLPEGETCTFLEIANEETLFGPNPREILHAVTASAVAETFNLEGLEILGDSFLKYVTTVYCYKAYSKMHEGKLSLLRSRMISNYNLYKLGKRKNIPQYMIAIKFDPSDTWLPPCYVPLNCEVQDATIEEEDKLMEQRLMNGESVIDQQQNVETTGRQATAGGSGAKWVSEDLSQLVPFNLLAQQGISDKGVADCVEALIGAYLLSCGTRRTLDFLHWLGLKVEDENFNLYGVAKSALISDYTNSEACLKTLWNRFSLSQFENIIGYRFKDRSLLVQALTHSTYFYNEVTDCYQRLEFLGDAVLDHLITRHLYEDKRMHSPGMLTDLRSALVNNTIFSSLSVKYKFHHYFMYLCPGLMMMIEKFVKTLNIIKENANFDREVRLYLLEEEEENAEEQVEVPKALGDIFESVAGAIYLDSGCSLHTVWCIYYNMLREEIEKCCLNPPISPIRDLLELEPDRVKFSRIERNAVEGKVKVAVTVEGKGRFVGVGRSYRIAKSTAAKRALRYLKRSPQMFHTSNIH
ncbi:Endoribonuclease dcr-1 [Trichinella pseudospiralis]|uniref:Endoribonuclease dcr-1 n=1 Tax=Trichinella pseudospiralis TaxID=6337 RepID=A0A0V1IQQ5_TRIPS|nr:Endoribonuclease dcr-1 [Trichinella pseudospiralis]